MQILFKVGEDRVRYVLHEGMEVVGVEREKGKSAFRRGLAGCCRRMRRRE